MIQRLIARWPAWVRVPIQIVVWGIFVVVVVIAALLAVIAFGGHVATAEAAPDSPGHFTTENPFPYPGTFDSVAPEVTPAYPGEVVEKQSGGSCRRGKVSDRIRSAAWLVHSTIARINAVLRFCHRDGAVQSHHFNTSISDCCAPYWHPDGPDKRRTSYKRWHGHPHGSFVGTYQQRFDFCPPVVGCVDASVLTIRIIGYANGHVHKNTNIPSI